VLFLEYGARHAVEYSARRTEALKSPYLELGSAPNPNPNHPANGGNNQHWVYTSLGRSCAVASLLLPGLRIRMGVCDQKQIR